jgi:hypothetical protein
MLPNSELNSSTITSNLTPSHSSNGHPTIRKSRGKKWTEEEDEALAKAWRQISATGVGPSDPVGSGSRFWERVAETYNAIYPSTEETYWRTSRSCSSRWSTVANAVTRFMNCLESLRQQQPFPDPMGDESKLYESAGMIYQSQTGQAFGGYIRAYQVLRDYPKFRFWALADNPFERRQAVIGQPGGVDKYASISKAMSSPPLQLQTMSPSPNQNPLMAHLPHPHPHRPSISSPLAADTMPVGSFDSTWLIQICIFLFVDPSF